MWAKIASAIVGPLANVLIDKLIIPLFNLIAKGVANSVDAIKDKIQMGKHKRKNKKAVEKFKDAKTKQSAKDSFSDLP